MSEQTEFYNNQYHKGYKEAIKKLKKIEEVVKDCLKNEFEICTLCKHSDKCRVSDEEYTSYDVAKYILEIIKGGNNGK